MFYKVLADQVKHFKETEGGRKIMSETFESLAEKRILDEKINIINVCSLTDRKFTAVILHIYQHKSMLSVP